MAKVNITLDKEEIKEEKIFISEIKDLTHEEKIKLEGFLKGLSFIKNCKKAC